MNCWPRSEKPTETTTRRQRTKFTPGRATAPYQVLHYKGSGLDFQPGRWAASREFQRRSANRPASGFDHAAGNVRRIWIDFDGLATWRNDQVEIFHWHGAEQHLLSDHQGADETRSNSKDDLDRSNVIANVALAVCGRYFALLNRLKLQLQSDMSRQTEMHRAGVNKLSFGRNRSYYFK